MRTTAKVAIVSEVAEEKTGDKPGQDWAVLTQALVDEFPLIAVGEVVESITRCRQAVRAFGLAEAEHLTIVGVMVRHQLMQLCGRVPDRVRHKAGQRSRRDRPDAGA